MFKDKQLSYILILLFALGTGTVLWYIKSSNFKLTNSPIVERIKEVKQQEESNFPQNILFSSPAFNNGENIPVKYTCQGDDISPPLEIKNVPPETKSLLIKIDDPDSPFKTWNHWTVFDIPAQTNFIPEGTIPEGAGLAENDFGKGEYGGPCPPVGEHVYEFTIYALDKTPNMVSGADLSLVKEEINGHILDSGRFTGKFKKVPEESNKPEFENVETVTKTLD